MHHKARIDTIPLLLSGIVLAIIFSGCGLTGCAKNEDAQFSLKSSSLSYAGTTPDAIIIVTPPEGTTFTKLVWDAPSNYDDGSPLDPIELQEYRVYFKPEFGSYSVYTVSAPDLVSAPATSVLFSEVIGQATGTYIFSVTAVARATGKESIPTDPIATFIH